MASGPFLPGQEVSRRMYEEGVRPILDRHAAGLPYAAALIGPGSDVLGYDTARSMDHDWGPRLTILLPDDQQEGRTQRLDRCLQEELPQVIAGFPTFFREFPDDPGIMHMVGTSDPGDAFHRVRITSVPAFLDEMLSERSIDDLDIAAWLTIPEQTLLEVTGGEVFHDEVGELTRARSGLAWYPDDVWRYRLAAGWKRIAQVAPFVGRAGEVGDDLGFGVIALSLIRDLMRLALLQERRYAPYAKWLGTAFGALDVAGALKEHLDRARFARSWQEREEGVVAAAVILAERQNDLALSEWVDPAPHPFFSRPFTVVDADRFAESLTDAITDPAVRVLPPMLGGIDQYMDSTDALGNREMRQVLRAWLREP